MISNLAIDSVPYLKGLKLYNNLDPFIRNYYTVKFFYDRYIDKYIMKGYAESSSNHLFYNFVMTNTTECSTLATSTFSRGWWGGSEVKIENINLEATLPKDIMNYFLVNQSKANGIVNDVKIGDIYAAKFAVVVPKYYQDTYKSVNTYCYALIKVTEIIDDLQTGWTKDPSGAGCGNKGVVGKDSDFIQFDVKYINMNRFEQ